MRSWGYEIGRLRRGHLGKTVTRNGSSDRSAGTVLTMSWCLAERHLRHLLMAYQNYYNEARTHLSLEKDAPIARAVHAIGQTLAVPVLGGLHHQYVRK